MPSKKKFIIQVHKKQNQKKNKTKTQTYTPAATYLTTFAMVRLHFLTTTRHLWTNFYICQ